ncbi:S24 family peptidase [Aequorivita echinoideorum]|uniref:Peptidase S24 n=1 Tax=Aequorivita echinoideorum TaxID=1549647 RepID=A0ABS5SAP7_9FLAO|nr:S24 family peptidase [Aequorivita echinoideorum]MBT0608950.1 peptidase S24 [Aequorivita echinoideorum]
MEIFTSGKLTKVKSRHEPGVSKQTGFSSPATHYLEPTIDLNQELVINRDATFFVRIDGNAFTEYNILDKDVLVIDRSLSRTFNDLALVIKEGEFKIQRIPFGFSEEEITVWGIITYIIHYAR